MEEIEVLDRAEISGTTVLVAYSKTEAALAELRIKHAGVVFDMTTTKGDKDARAARLELKTLRTSLEAKRKELKTPALTLGKKIDTEAERVTAEILALENFIDQQIKADEKRRADEKAEKEQAEALRVQGLRDKIASIRACLTRCNGITAERIAKGIALVELLDVSAEVFAELAPDAELAKSETLAAMRALHTVTTEREAEAARVDAQRVENERVAGVLKAQSDALEVQQAEINAARKKVEDATKASAEAIAKAQAEAAALVTNEAVVEIMMPTTVIEAMNPAPATVQQASAAIETVAVETPEIVLTGRMVSAPLKIMSESATEPNLKLGQMAERLGFPLTAAFLLELGFEHSATEKAAKLYHEAEWPLICAALIERIESACELQSA